MKVVKKMQVRPEAFFDLMMASVKADVEQVTGKPVREADIKAGFTYKKNLLNKLGKEGSSIGTFVRVERPLAYEVEFKTARGLNKIAYEIKKLDDEQIEVSYEEIYEAVDKRHELNQKLVGFFYKRGTEKRMMRLLDSMEQYLLQQKE